MKIAIIGYGSRGRLYASEFMKANDVEIAKLVVELKGEIEKLREQVQNIE